MLGLPSVSDREAGAANRAFFWAAVVGVLLLVPLDVFVQQFHRGLRERTVRSPARDVAMSERVEAPGIGVLTLQSKYHVRIREHVALKGMRFEEQPDWRAVVADLERLAESRVERARVAIVAAEVLGRQEGLRRLDDLLAEVDPGGGLAADIGWFKRVLTEGADVLGDEAAASLRARHGWFAEVAIARGNSDVLFVKGPPTRGGDEIVGAMGTMGLMNLLLIVAGVIAALLLSALWRQGFLTSAGFVPSHTPTVYVETFCIFLLTFIVLVGTQVLSMWSTGIASVTMYVVTEILLWSCALAAAWPVLRGAGLEHVKRDLGWTRGEGFWAEALCGVLAFLVSVPLMHCAAMVVGLFESEAPAGTEEHGYPTYTTPLGNSWVPVIVGCFSAVVWAPLVEETMYRGALYHAVRQMMGPWLAIPLTAIAFGAAHPYGMSGLVMVTIAGIGFGLLREWRGTLIAPITMHALHNGWISIREVWILAAID